MRAMKKVLVVSTVNGIAGRNGLVGIFNYVNDGRDWSIRFLQNPGEVDATALGGVVKEGMDGIIICPREMTPQIRNLLAQPIPVVLVDNPDKTVPEHGSRFALLKNDDVAAGRVAAEYFLSRSRFRSYAFVPTATPTNWSAERLRGFADTLAAKRIRPVAWRPGRESLEEFVASLPRPAAVLGATDIEAVNVLDVCRKKRIDVPSKVAVLGVDDDEMMCEATVPTLSSVRTDDVSLGRMAAKELESLMSSKKPRLAQPPILVPPIGVTERNSTRVVPPSGHIIQEALSFAKRHLSEGIGVDDVVKHLGVSDSLVRKRFRTVYGTSLRDVIIDMRLKAAMSLLAKTNASVHSIALRTGFSSDAYFTNFFRRMTNTTPSAFRATRRRRSS